MSNLENEHVVREFKLTARRLNSCSGISKLINIVSERFSLQTTILIQMLGANRRIARKAIKGKLIINIGGFYGSN